MNVDRSAVEAFLYQEARFMDEHRYQDWLALFEDDALYWIPSNRDDVDPLREISIVYADRAQLEAQIARLESGRAYTQEPRSRMRRVVSNVEIGEADGEHLTVYSNFNLTEVRGGRQRVIAGRTIHHLRRRGESFRIMSKKVELVANDEVVDDLTFLV